MEQLKLTPEERRLLWQIAAQGPTKYLWSHAPYLLPPIVFGIYGVAKHDAGAIITAFLVLVIVELWIVSSTARSYRLWSSLCARILALEKGDDGQK
jgi:hypothetical protein